MLHAKPLVKVIGQEKFSFSEVLLLSFSLPTLLWTCMLYNCLSPESSQLLYMPVLYVLLHNEAFTWRTLSHLPTHSYTIQQQNIPNSFTIFFEPICAIKVQPLSTPIIKIMPPLWRFNIQYIAVYQREMGPSKFWINRCLKICL